MVPVRRHSWAGASNRVFDWDVMDYDLIQIHSSNFSKKHAVGDNDTLSGNKSFQK
jgi:hypothetical protein